MEWGGQIKKLVDMKEKTGITPIALQNIPETLPRLVWYMEQYRGLQRDRKYAEGTALPLSTTDIVTYFKAFNLSNFEDFYDNIVRIDGAYLEAVEKKPKRESVTHAAPVKTSPPAAKGR